MKKYFGLMLFALLIIAFSATAYATDLTAAGFIRVDSLLYTNINGSGGTLYGAPDTDHHPNGGAFDRTEAYMKSRARIRFDVKQDKNLSGTFFFEFDSDRWGDLAGSTAYGSGQRNKFGYWSGDRSALEVKNIYMDFGLPYFGIPVPMTVRAGLQGLSIRYDAGFVSLDGMGLNAAIKADPVTINPFWYKAWEGLDAAADDNDLFGLQLIAKINKTTIGAYGLYFNMNTYPNPASSSVGSYGSTPVQPYTADMYWLGAYSDGKMGPVDYKLDFITDFGKVKSKVNPAFEDVDYAGWLTRARLVYPWEKFQFGFVGMYASGADQKKTSATGYPGSTTPYGTTTSKVKTFTIVPGGEVTGFGEDFIVYDNYDNAPNTMESGTTGSGTNGKLSRGIVGGTWMAKLFAANQVLPWWKMTLSALYIGDTTKNGNSLADAVKTDGLPRDDKTIGWELMIENEILIWKGLQWFIGGGYLFAGDALDYRVGTTNTNKSGDDPWQIATRLLYTF